MWRGTLQARLRVLQEDGPIPGISVFGGVRALHADGFLFAPLRLRQGAITVNLAEGTSRIEVRYADAGARAWTATGGALALTIGLLLLLVAFRSHPDDDDIGDEDEA